MSVRPTFKPAFSIIFICGFLLVSSVKAQESFHYQFKISGVSSLSTAKPVTTLMRTHFNTEEDPNKYLPNYDVNTQGYNFNSSQFVSEVALVEMLALHGYSVLEFEYKVIVEK